MDLRLPQKLALESDRGCVLVAAAEIDEGLTFLLRQFFEHAGKNQNKAEIEKIVNFLFYDEPIPPLGSMGTKARLCYLTGQINEVTYKQLKALSKLRNAMAHSSVPTELTRNDIATITCTKRWGGRIKKVHQEVRKSMSEMWRTGDARRFSSIRHEFITAATIMHHALMYSAVLFVTARKMRRAKLDQRVDLASEWQLPPP